MVKIIIAIPRPMDKIPEFLTIAEFAKIIRISMASAYRIIYSREIPFYRVGRVVRIDCKDVLVYIEKSRVDSREEWK